MQPTTAVKVKNVFVIVTYFWHPRLGNSFVTFQSSISPVAVSFRCVRHRDRPAEQIAAPTTLGLLTIERPFSRRLLQSGA
jgi:hypothetical protein